MDGIHAKSSGPFAGHQISHMEIMKAILETTGPVTTPRAFKSVKRSMAKVTSKMFLEAAAELEKNNFGKLRKILTTPSGQPAVVFIKKPPSEMEEILRSSPTLCTFELYAERYAKVPSKAIGLQLRAKLVAMNLVPKKCFV